MLLRLSVFEAPIALGNVTVGAAMMALRTSSETVSAYPHLIATSSNEQVCFAAVDRRFPGHHAPASSPIPIDELFSRARPVLSKY